MHGLIDRIVVPPRLALILRGGETVGFDPERNVWHRLTPEAAEALRWLRARRPRDQLAAHLVRRFGYDRGAERVEQLLKWCILRQLLYVDRAAPPPKLQYTPRLDSVYWISTQACNLRCTYCYQEATVRRPQELTTAEAFDLVEQVVEAGASTLVITGGEPFSRRDLLSVATYSRSLGLRTNVITNGNYITKRNVERVAEAFDRVTVSLDSGTPTHHDTMRGEGSWAHAAAAIDLLISHGVSVDVNSTVTHDGIADADELLRFVYERPIGSHRISPQSPMGRGQEHRGDEMAVEDFLDLDQTMHRLRASDPNSLDDRHYRRKGLESKGQLRNHCGAGLAEVSIDPEGWLYPCKLLQDPDSRCANIRMDRIRDQWSSHPTLVDIQRPFTDHLKPCSTCAIRFHCGGGCRGIHASRSGDWRTVDPLFCAHMRRNFEVMVFASSGDVPDRTRADFIDGAESHRPPSVLIPVADLFKRSELMA